MTVDANNYSIVVRFADVEGDMMFEARVDEFPHLIFYAASSEQAYNSAVSGVNDLIVSLKRRGKNLPELADPDKSSQFSGRVTLRIPKSLHRALYECSEREGTSLNQWLVSILSYRLADPFSSPEYGSSWQTFRLTERQEVSPTSSTPPKPKLSIVDSSTYARAG